MKNDKEIRRICSLCGLQIVDLMEQAKMLRKIMEKRGLLDLPLLIGFDINGPLASTKDASMTPYKGAPEALRFLSNLPNTKLCLVTGWDLTTVKIFANRLIELPDIDIVSEKGMIYSNENKVHHIYPHSDVELIDFAKALFDVAARDNLQIAIQPNISSGCQCVYFERYRRARLDAHPLMKGVKVESYILEDALTRHGIKHSVQHDFIEISATAAEVYNVLKKELPLFPIRILSGANSEDQLVCIKVDTEEDQCFGWGKLESTAKDIAKRINCLCDLNADYSVDFSTSIAIQGGYSKDCAIKMLGRKVFHDRFVIFNVGDKPDDSVKGDNALFFPQRDSDAMGVQSNVALPVADGREYALILALYRLMK